MHVERKTYAVMEGEPHLGSQTELELIAGKHEVEDWILERAVDNGIVQAEYDFDEYTIISEDYIDVEMVNDYLENTEEVDEVQLYTSAFVEAPKHRRK